MRLSFAAGAAMLTLAVAGCGKPPEPAKAPPETALPPISANSGAKAEPFQPAGPPQSMKPASENGLQAAASVVELTYLQKQGDMTVKLFGTAGGDPAMNGLYTYVAFFVDAGNGWRVFRLGDFLEYRIVSEEPGRIDLELKESVLNEASGEISSRSRRVILTWTIASGAEPETISVAQAK